MATKTWFITGASQGFGLIFIQQLLQKGDNVAATSRTIAALEKAAGTHPNLLPLEANLTDEASVKAAIDSTISRFGSLDVVVNNAGYGLLGGVEELSDAEVRKNFEVNVYGSLNVIRQAMPHLRTQGSGHIFNISSIGGFTGAFPGFGIYCATKFAMAGFTEALAEEAKPFGVKVSLVLPGYFRTNFLESTSLAVPENPLDAYANVRASQKAHQEQINGNQPGDPEKGVAEMIKIADAGDAPLYLFLGTDALAAAEAKIEVIKNEIDIWKGVSSATNF
jgi:NAD(P)-dependent dehydrogenase (short-subunit alcohol dehydrogenase family)